MVQIGSREMTETLAERFEIFCW